MQELEQRLLAKAKQLAPVIDASRKFTSCLARGVCCVLLNKDLEVLSAGVNQCVRQTPGCERLTQLHGRSYGDYKDTPTCGSIHAEIEALEGINWYSEDSDFPVYWVVVGHRFICPDCEAALKAHGLQSGIVIEHL